MALDRLLLNQNQTRPVLRFYQWSGPWLSLGRHQRSWPEHWNELVQAKEITLVRRPSGGRAVLHSGGLTYALLWPDAPRRRRQAYLEACQWLIDGFSTLGLSLCFGHEIATTDCINCFAQSTAADLVDSGGVKRIGSAQCWQQGRLLQHGEIVLDPSVDLWRSVFKEAPPVSAPSSIPRDTLDKHLSNALKRSWSETDWHTEGLSISEHQELASLVSSSVLWA
ncbi:lipoate--protein ligase family protein [Synechococcus sp. M16CYN]|uniref:lipoate--protein ligase family protein n=1 Tax=Synechococcus sp. M16CYN TaxID=3103139 RepID=UPI00333FBAC3